MRKLVPSMRLAAEAAIAIAALLPAAHAKYHLPGDPHYYTMLGMFGASDGVLKPPFSPETLKYELEIKDPDVKEVTLMFRLDETKYSNQGLPHVIFNDSRHEYVPLSANKKKVALDADIGDFDETIEIKVADPKSGGFMQGANEHIYSIRILQAPEFKKVTTPTNITVVTLEGEVLESNPPYSLESPSQNLHYTANRTDFIYLIVECSKWVEILKIDGMQVNMDKAASRGVLVHLSHLHSARSIQCLYTHDRWSPAGEGELYSAAFTELIDVSGLEVTLMVQETEGHCAKRTDVDNKTYTACRLGGDENKFIAEFSGIASAEQVSGVLRNATRGSGKDGSGGVVLLHEVQTPARLPHSGDYELMVNASGEPRIFPIKVVAAAHCSTLPCPRGQAHKFAKDAPLRLCEKEKCTDDDIPACCTEAATCSDMKCPVDTVLKCNSEEIFCNGSECRSHDQHQCCVTPAYCSANPDICGVGYRLRDDATFRECKTHFCDLRDADQCCEPCSDLNATGCSNYTLCPECEGVEEPQACCSSVTKKALEAEVDKCTPVKSNTKDRKIEHYKNAGCFPEANTSCRGELCFYDETCNKLEGGDWRLGGLGCWASGIDWHCRFCGFRNYPPCPKDPDCFDTFENPCETWTDAKRAHCKAAEQVECKKFYRKDWKHWKAQAIVRKDGAVADLPLRQRPATLWLLGAACGAVVLAFTAGRLAQVPQRPRDVRRFDRLTLQGELGELLE